MELNKILRKVISGEMQIFKDNEEYLKRCLDYCFPLQNDTKGFNEECIGNYSFFYAEDGDIHNWGADKDSRNIETIKASVLWEKIESEVTKFSRNLGWPIVILGSGFCGIRAEVSPFNDPKKENTPCPEGHKKTPKTIEEYLEVHRESLSDAKVDLLRALTGRGLVIAKEETEWSNMNGLDSLLHLVNDQDAIEITLQI